MPRDMGSISHGRYADENVWYWHCLRIDWNLSAIERRTTFPAETLILDVEGTGADQTWDGTKVWAPGNYEQGEQTILSISDVVLGNADDEVAKMILAQPNGIRGVKFALWEILFDMTPPYTFADAPLFGVWKVYEGEGDTAEIGDEVHVGLIALKHPMLTPYPRRMFTPAFGFDFLPPQNTTFTWGGSRAEAPPATGFFPIGPGGSGGRMPVVNVAPRPPTTTLPPRSTTPGSGTAPPRGPARGSPRVVNR